MITYTSMIELDYLGSLTMLMVYGLLSVKGGRVDVGEVYNMARMLPMTVSIGYLVEGGDTTTNMTIGVIVGILTSVIMNGFRTLESILLMLLAFTGNMCMLHSVDVITLFISLEAQSFSFFVLCGLLSRKRSASLNVEASIKYLVYSSITTGAILYWLSKEYSITGSTNLWEIGEIGVIGAGDVSKTYNYLIMCALLFKLGAAPLHLWVSNVYGNVKREIICYVSTVPKLSIIGFWLANVQTTFTNSSVVLFSLGSLLIGSLGAYNMPALRGLFAYSTVNEMGIILLAVEAGGEHAIYQHLGIYIISQLLIWKMSEKRMFTVVAVTLAGLPPLAGFFGKAFVFWYSSSIGMFGLVGIALASTFVSLVFYLRIVRLFWNSSMSISMRLISNAGETGVKRADMLHQSKGLTSPDTNIALTSLCVITLFYAPIFVIKPFVCFA